MSLDVYLMQPGQPAVRPESIWIRRGGATVQITREEWDELNPGREPVVLAADVVGDHEVFTANITHNMSRMAGEVGLYEPLWEPRNAVYARDLIEPLRLGLTRLRDERERLQEYNPANGWGNYDLLVRFTEGYLAACEEYPDAEIEVSR